MTRTLLFGFLVGACITAFNWLLLAVRRKKKDKTRESEQPTFPKKLQSFTKAEIDTGSISVDKLYREVERKKEQAKKLGIGPMALYLYRDHLKYYPGWIQTDRDNVHAIFTEAHKLPDDKVQITVDDRKYTFVYKEETFSWMPEPNTVINFQIYHANELVFEGEFYEEKWGRFKLHDIKAFKDGEWVNHLNKLGSSISDLEAEQEILRKKKESEDPEKIKDLKNRFGIK